MTRSRPCRYRRIGLAATSALVLVLALATSVAAPGAVAGEVRAASMQRASMQRASMQRASMQEERSMQEDTPHSDASGRGLLAEGAGASVAPDAPARLVLDPARTATGLVSLALTPTRVAPDEAFIVSVAAVLPAGERREIGTYAFFPPPTEGTTRRFPLDLTSLPDGDGPITLEVRLLPVGAALEETRLRVEGVTAGSEGESGLRVYPPPTVHLHH